jgi:CRISPR-associated protein (TIGR03984 family)
LRWLLAHDLDGVIWGELRSDHLHLSCAPEAFGTGDLTLQWETLQQARLFSSAGELMLWYGPRGQTPAAPSASLIPAGWQARLFQDAAPDQAAPPLACIDEAYLLWGTSAPDPARAGFRRYREGAQGISHTPPLTEAPHGGGARGRARLHVRHYLHEDPQTGEVTIGASRLVNLEPPQ